MPVPRIDRTATATEIFMGKKSGLACGARTNCIESVGGLNGSTDVRRLIFRVRPVRVVRQLTD